MVRRVLRYDTVDGMWRMDEQQYEDTITDNAIDDWHRAKNNQIAGAVLDESQQIQSRKAHIKRDRREALISRALTFAIALVVIGLVLIALGVVR